MKGQDRFLKSIIYKIFLYKKALNFLFKQLFKKSSHQKDVDYYEYISKTKQLHCKHKNITKVSSTKFYCVDCGKVFHFISEEMALLSELFGMFLIGSIVYLLTKKRK